MNEHSQPLLLAHQISKRYYAVQALDDVSIDLWPGEVHAVVGENGAGKTTLMRILGGEERPDRGQIVLDGREVRFHSPLEAQNHGIAVVHQHFQLVPAMTVAENIALGILPCRARLGPIRVLDRRRIRADAREIIARLAIDLDPNATVASLGVAEKQLLEIVKALARRSRVLILDEPTASLEQVQVETLFGHIRALTRHGTAVIFISHKVNEMLAIADRVTVLRDGKRVGTARAAGLDSQALVRMIVGRAVGDMFHRDKTPTGETLVQGERVSVATAAAPFSFEVKRGEVFGVTGLLGAGVSRLFKILCGAERTVSGAIRILGRPLRGSSVKAAVRSGVCFVPGDRHTEGLVLDRSVEENIILPNLQRLSRYGVVSSRACRALSRRLIETLDIRPPNPKATVKYLSGGNQQKVVIAKWLASRAQLLVMDDPTKGVDIGAKAEIHKVMGRFVADGRAILFTSSELPEVIGISDRLLVMHQGAAAGHFGPGEMDPERIMACATGVSQAEPSQGRAPGPGGTREQT